MECEDQELHPAVRALKTICRCNNIKYRTIERAIREGADTIAKVAAKTTATTGHCGGSCTPEVQAMLEAHHAAMNPPAEKPAVAAEDVPWWER